MSTPIYIACDHVVSYLGATDPDGTVLNDGTSTYVLSTVAGVAVSGGAGALAYVEGSDGDYQATIDAAVTATLTDGTAYFLTITFSQDGFDDQRRLTLVAEHREGD